MDPHLLCCQTNVIVNNFNSFYASYYCNLPILVFPGCMSLTIFDSTGLFTRNIFSPYPLFFLLLSE